MADRLVAELQLRGHEAETVSVPFKWYPGTRVLDQAFLWRLLDLTEAERLRALGWRGPILLLEGFFDPQDIALIEQSDRNREAEESA